MNNHDSLHSSLDLGIHREGHDFDKGLDALIYHWVHRLHFKETQRQQQDNTGLIGYQDEKDESSW